MRIDELTVEVRDENLARVGQILPKDLVGFKAVLRFNNVGSWEIVLPDGHEVGDVLRQPGSGIIVTGPTGVILSGPTMSATNSKTSDNPAGDWHIIGVDDSVVLGERLAYPTPSSADVSAQTNAYDTRTGIASTAMYGYVTANIGSGAPLSRQIPGLVTGADTALGSTVYPSARFDILGELLSGIASVDGLGFDIKQVDGTLEFSVYEPTDRSGYIRMDVANNTLSKTEYAYGSHALSRAIVAGQGQGVDRQFIEVTSTESLQAETLWGRRIESFVDQRNTNDTNELTQAGKEKLADGGATLTSVDVVPSSDLTMAYGKDWNLGDQVTVVVGGQEVSSTVTTVSMSIEPDGVRVGATVGEPAGVDYEALISKKQTSTARRVNALERKEGGGTSAGVLEQEVKNDQGASIYKGQAVYVSGANGTNVLVKLAKADAEATSSKTLGLMSEDLGVNGIGKVLTEGFLGGLDTSSATAGDAVWLSPSTAGGLVYGSNKPSAPNHLVYIGVVLRSNANNGEIYVKVQNGFELNELHDVAISSPTTDQVIQRDADGTWKNKTLQISSIIPSDTKPTNPAPNTLWFNTNDGSVFLYWNDGSSSQWVEIKNPNNYTGDTAINAFSSRMTAVESLTTSLNSRVNVIESNNGFFTRQIFSDIDTTERTFGTGWQLMYGTPDHVNFLSGSKVKIHIELPLRNDSTSWGGAYVEPQITFNGGTNWYSLGSSGYDGNVMYNQAQSIATYTRMLYVDPQIHGVSGEFRVAVRIYCKTYDGTGYWNGNHNLNATSGTASAINGSQNWNQHYARIHIEEMAVIL